MLYIKNLDVTTNTNKLFFCAEFVAKRGNITLIKGNSGVGKTTFIQYLSFQKDNNAQLFELEGKNVSLLSNKEKDLIKRNYFSFVFQDSKLFSKLTVKRNLEIALAFDQYKTKTENLVSLLQKVHLSMELLNTRVSKLSGGEKQRLALALSIAKNTPYIILDEPTANLDESNQEIVENILEDLKQEGKGIIVISHNFPENKADLVYEINNKEMLCKKKTFSTENKLNMNKISENKVFFKWIFRNPIHLLHTILLLGICVGICGSIFIKGNSVYKSHEETIKNTTTNELIVVNGFGLESEDDYTALSHHYLAFTDMQKVQLSEVCKESYPLDIFGYTHVYLFNKEGEMKPTDIPTQLVIRKENGEEILVNYKECIDFGGQIVIMSLEGNYARNMVTSTSDSTDEGIYLSKEFADYVGISDYKNMTISLSFFVPIGEIEAMYSSFDSNDNLRFSSKSRLPLQVLIEKEFNIIGIRERGPYLSFGSGYDLVFYLPLDTMSKIKKEASIEYSWLFEDEQIKEELQLKEWNTAFYMIVPEKESDIPNVISEIRNINPNFTIVSNNENVNYLANVVKQEQVGFKTFATSVVFVIGLIFVCIYLYSIKQEEWGLTYLKANGLNIGQMVFADLLVNGCLSFYVSVMTLYLYCSFINYKYGFLFMYFSSEAFMFFLSIYSIIISFGYISLKMKILGNFDFSKLNCKS